MSNPFKSKSKQTSRSMPDPWSQHYIQQTRRMAARGANDLNRRDLMTGPLTEEEISGAMNPWQEGVIDRMMTDWGHSADLGLNQIGQQAAQRGAFGSRRDVAEGQFLADQNRNMLGQIAGLRHQGYREALNLAEHQRQLRERKMQEPLFRAQSQLALRNMGLGPVGTWSTAEKEGGGNWLGQLMGLVSMGMGIFGNQQQPMQNPFSTPGNIQYS